MIRSRAAHPGFNFEYLMWVFTRISGISLIVLGAFGMLAGLALGARFQMDLATLMRWSFFPNPNHVVNSNVLVLENWTTAFWAIMQMLLVALGITHGFNGLRIVAEDFIGTSVLRPVIRSVVFLLWIFALIMAVYVINAS
jgi:succinate dehydrogenase hydrophobic anchor subunit